MILIISPAKTLDYNKIELEDHSLPRLMHDSRQLVGVLRKKSAKKLSQLMSINDNIALENEARYRRFDTENFTEENSKQALFAFRGHVYLGLKAEDFDAADITYAQEHLRILSGLYGLLKPLDRMQPYRLEMGTKLKTRRGENLYKFWGDRITKLLNEDLAAQGDEVLINLASQEYFKSIRSEKFKGRVINIQFKELRGDQYKMVSVYAKTARGLMCRYAIKNKLTDPEELKGFDYEGYYFNEDLSSENDWVFTRLNAS